MRILHEPVTDEVLSVRSEHRHEPQHVEWRCVDDRWQRWSPLEQAWRDAEPPALVSALVDGDHPPTEHERFRIVDGEIERILVLDERDG